MRLLIAGLEVAISTAVLSVLFLVGEVTLGRKGILAIVSAGLIPLAVVQIWVLVLLVRAYLRHPQTTRLRDYLRNYIYKAVAFVIFALVALDGVLNFLPGLSGGVLLVAGIYVLAVPGVVEIVRFYSSHDGRS